MKNGPLAMFPSIEPFASGLLPTDDGNQIYWETSGNPGGFPALHVHGGPGGGIGAGYRRRFDPERFLIVGFEQRGCGRSRPLATDPAAPPLATNTSQALIADMEALRIHLGIDRWLLEGMSWGTALAIAYAQAHPDRVAALALFAVGTCSRREVDWITQGIGRVFPREWERFAAAVDWQPGRRVIDLYHERLTDLDPAIRADAARSWCAWEDAHMSLMPNGSSPLSATDPAFQQTFATLVVHYWRHDGFFDPPLLSRMDRVAHLPAVLIHGRLDISGPAETAWRLHRAWPGSKLIVIDDEGHGGPRMISALTDAIAGFSSLA